MSTAGHESADQTRTKRSCQSPNVGVIYNEAFSSLPTLEYRDVIVSITILAFLVDALLRHSHKQ